MKKIMFNDKYGLTQAVLEGRKTMTRRVITDTAAQWERFKHGLNTRDWDSPFLLFVPIAIAQSYASLGKPVYGMPYNNKMFVRASDMPHHIKMKSYRVERLQDISDEDCMKEGIRRRDDVITSQMEDVVRYQVPGMSRLFATPKEAYAELIDKVSGKGTWASNPLVWVYEFELVD